MKVTIVTLLDLEIVKEKLKIKAQRKIIRKTKIDQGLGQMIRSLIIGKTIEMWMTKRENIIPLRLTNPWT
jgi:hypothetical protein